MSKPGSGPESTLGGRWRDFPSTAWSRFSTSRVGDEAGRRAALETLAASYWKPIYSYMRRWWGKSSENAKDLTQDFFLWMMESSFLGQADPRRGRFRAFLKVALEHYLRNEYRNRRRQKRGGGRAIVPIDGDPGTAGVGDIPDAAAKTPEEVLDAEWKAQLLTEATRILEERYRTEGREVYFSLYRDYFLSESEETDYGRMAEKYAIRESDVSNFLMHAKRRYRDIVCDLISETVTSDEELREELKQLFGGRS